MIRNAVLTVAVLTVLVLIAPPVCAEPEGGFATPPPSLLEKLRLDQDVFGWLRVTTDSTRLEVRALVIGDHGLSGLTFRRTAPPPPESIPWSSISRIDAGGSRLRTAGFGAVAGAVILGTVGGALGSTTGDDESWDQVMGALYGGLAGGIVGVGVGGLVGAVYPPWHKVYERRILVRGP